MYLFQRLLKTKVCLYDCFFFFSARVDATQVGKDLVRRHFIHHVTYEHDFEDEYLFYRFLGDVKTRALNARLSNNCLPRKGELISLCGSTLGTWYCTMEHGTVQWTHGTVQWAHGTVQWTHGTVQ